MKNLKYITSIFSMPLMVVCLYISASGQTAEDMNRLATISGAGSSVRWDVSAANAGGARTILGPGGRGFRRGFKSGAPPQFTLLDFEGNRFPQRAYTYQMRLTPAQAKLPAARARG